MDDSPPEPDFGPSGYLPGRAAKRARKIVLRAPLGLQWLLASVAFGVTVLVAGLVFLRASGPPAAPYEPTVSLTDVTGDVAALPDLSATLVLAGGRVSVFANPGRPLTYCPATRRLLDGSGGLWSVDGRGLGTRSLERHPTTVHDGVVYVDPTRRLPGPPPADTYEQASCP